MPDIAVVIPCFNLGRTIEEAVESVLAQTRSAAEIIVVDDESTDLYTRQRLASLVRPGLRTVRIGHLGPSGARNYGASMTSSPYLLFLDADDALEPTYLERTAGCLDETPAVDFVSTALQGFAGATYVWTPPHPDLATALTRGTIPVTAMLRRTLWDATGGFDERLPVSEDRDFWISALERGFRGCVIDEPLLRRRVRWDSLHHAAVTRGTHRDVLEVIPIKHRASIERLGPSVLLAKEAFIQQQQADRVSLQRHAHDLRGELGRLNDQIRSCRNRLRQSGEAVVDLAEYPRVEPVSPFWGVDRGQPIDRYYIEKFLAAHRTDVRGRVLEVKDPHYTNTFGSTSVTARDVLDVVPHNMHATIVADLARADSISDERFDCFILTQTLHIIADVRAALFHAHRILAPGGTLLATLPAVSRINYEDGGLDAGDFWRFTEASVRRLFGEVFGSSNVDVVSQGNLKASIGFLYGLASDDFLVAELDQSDPRCPLVYCVRAVKESVASPERAFP